MFVNCSYAGLMYYHLLNAILELKLVSFTQIYAVFLMISRLDFILTFFQISDIISLVPIIFYSLRVFLFNPICSWLFQNWYFIPNFTLFYCSLPYCLSRDLFPPLFDEIWGYLLLIIDNGRFMFISFNILTFNFFISFPILVFIHLVCHFKYYNII